MMKRQNDDSRCYSSEEHPQSQKEDNCSVWIQFHSVFDISLATY